MRTDSEVALAKIDRNDRYMRRMTGAFMAVLLALVLVFGIWDRVDSANSRQHLMQTLTIVKDATDPNSQLSQQGRAQQAQVVRGLIVCIEADINKQPKPAGCP